MLACMDDREPVERIGEGVTCLNPEQPLVEETGLVTFAWILTLLWGAIMAYPIYRTFGGTVADIAKRFGL